MAELTKNAQQIMDLVKELTIVELVKYINKEISVLPINVISCNKGIIKYSKKLQMDIPFGIVKDISYATFIDAPILDIENLMIFFKKHKKFMN